MLLPQKYCLFLHFRENLTCLNVCRLSIGHVFCVFCKTVYRWVKTACCSMNDMFPVQCKLGAEEVAFDLNMILDQRSTKISPFTRYKFKIDCKSTPKTQRNLSASCAERKRRAEDSQFQSFGLNYSPIKKCQDYNRAKGLRCENISLLRHYVEQICIYVTWYSYSHYCFVMHQHRRK